MIDGIAAATARLHGLVADAGRHLALGEPAADDYRAARAGRMAYAVLAKATAEFGREVDRPCGARRRRRGRGGRRPDRPARGADRQGGAVGGADPVGVMTAPSRGSKGHPLVRRVRYDRAAACDMISA